MVIHIERSIFALKTNRQEFTQKAGAAAPKEAWWYTSWWWHSRCSSVSPLSIWLPHLRDGCCFLGESSLKSRSGGLTIAVIYFPSQTLSELKFFASDRRCFSAEMWGGVGRTEASPRISAVLFSSYKLPKTVTVTTLLLFGQVTLLCGTFLCIKLREGTV